MGFFGEIFGRKSKDIPPELDKDSEGDMGIGGNEFDHGEKTQEVFFSVNNTSKYHNPFEGNLSPKDMTGVNFNKNPEDEKRKLLAKLQNNRASAIARDDQQSADAIRRAIAELK